MPCTQHYKWDILNWFKMNISSLNIYVASQYWYETQNVAINSFQSVHWNFFMCKIYWNCLREYNLTAKLLADIKMSFNWVGNTSKWFVKFHLKPVRILWYLLDLLAYCKVYYQLILNSKFGFINLCIVRYYHYNKWYTSTGNHVYYQRYKRYKNIFIMYICFEGKVIHALYKLW